MTEKAPEQPKPKQGEKQPGISWKTVTAILGSIAALVGAIVSGLDFIKYLREGYQDFFLLGMIVLVLVGLIALWLLLQQKHVLKRSAIPGWDGNLKKWFEQLTYSKNLASIACGYFFILGVVFVCGSVGIFLAYNKISASMVTPTLTRTPTPKPSLTATRTRVPTSTVTTTPTPHPSATPTLTQTPTPVYTYLVNDKFDTGVSSDWLPVSGTWKMVNNQYSITNIKANAVEWTSGTSFIGAPGWTDYHLGTLVHLQSAFSSRNSRAKIFVRVQDDSNYLVLILQNYVLFDLDHSIGYWKIVQNGQASDISGTNFTISTADQFRIDVEVQGDIVTTFMNDKQVSRFSSVPFLSGRVGVGIDSNNAVSPPAFDDFYVRLIDPQ